MSDVLVVGRLLAIVRKYTKTVHLLVSYCRMNKIQIRDAIREAVFKYVSKSVGSNKYALIEKALGHDVCEWISGYSNPYEVIAFAIDCYVRDVVLPKFMKIGGELGGKVVEIT